TKPAFWCPIRVLAISERCRKSAQTAFHAHCSSQYDSRSSLSRAGHAPRDPARGRPTAVHTAVCEPRHLSLTVWYPDIGGCQTTELVKALSASGSSLLFQLRTI